MAITTDMILIDSLNSIGIFDLTIGTIVTDRSNSVSYIKLSNDGLKESSTYYDALNIGSISKIIEDNTLPEPEIILSEIIVEPTNISSPSAAIEPENSVASDNLFEDQSANNNVISETAFSSGKNNEAVGDFSNTMGRDNVASGEASSSIGIKNAASGEAALSSGKETVAKGNFSVANNLKTIAKNEASFSCGKYNIGSDPLNILEVGIGISDDLRKNGLEIKIDGTLDAPELNIDNIVRPRQLVTKEYVDMLLATISALEARISALESK